MTGFTKSNIISYTFLLFIFFIFHTSTVLLAQEVIIEGYVYETGNRGYLNIAEVSVLEAETKALVGKATTDLNGKFELAVFPDKDYLIRISKKPFMAMEKLVSTKGKSDGDKIFERFEMQRLPGYIFEVTLAPARDNDNQVVDAITGAWIEVYNNTTEKEIMNSKNHPTHTFNVQFEQGNHYTILIRKKGFYNKRLEAYVNVEGCILCFDGVGEVKPGVSDVLTEGLEMGTLLANVELQPLRLNKEIEVKDIFYDKGSARLKTKSREELDKLAAFLLNNKSLLIEIGSHTDSRGDAKFNKKLSLKRAQAVVNYLVDKGIPKERMQARGYGESKLRNSCGNGVECSEARHRYNRRTEFKVIGFVHENLRDNRSLAEMKEEEKLQKLLKELEGTEIKITEDTELPDDLIKQLEGGKTDNSKIDKPAQATEMNQPIKTNVQTSVKPSKVTSSNTAKANQNKARQRHEEKIQTSESSTTTSNPTQGTPLPENESFDDHGFGEAGSMRVIPERPIKTAFYNRAPKKLPKDYTGYKIQIARSVSELPISHKIFSRHGNLVIEETKRGDYAYLLGDFKDKALAEDFMNNVLSSRYADARVVTYVDGRRVVD